MYGTRIEIKKDDVWQELYLGQKNKIKYNKVINRIGEDGGRKISHTNTFTIPKNYQNIKALGLNQFNSITLAKSLNTKYEAKYFVEDKLFQEGFIVINSTKDNLKLNFIGGGLEILDKWGVDSFQDILNKFNPDLPLEYQDAVSRIKSYYLPKDSQLTPLPKIQSKGYHLALFPNNLNTIGEEFNKVRVAGSDDLVGRYNDGFNPYQSRPLFNAFALMELACLYYGYEARFDPSVDTISLKESFIVNSGMDASYSDVSVTKKRSPIVSENSGLTSTVVPNGTKFNVISAQPYFSSVGITPNSLPNWISPVAFDFYDYENFRSIYIPDLSENYLGEINLYYSGENTTVEVVYGIWKDDLDTTTLFKVLPTRVINGGSAVSKTDLEVPPTNSGDFVGIIAFLRQTAIDESVSTISNLFIEETFLPLGVLELDEDKQYLHEYLNLSHGVPNIPIKSLLKSIMYKDAILMDIDYVKKEVFFFTYEKYEREIKSGNFKDLGKYLLKEYDFNYNTNFGNSYGVVNKLGLSSPYPGNEFKLNINSDIESKLKKEAKKYVPGLKDISKVAFVSNPNTPYFEYTNKGIGMVEYISNLGALKQINVEGIEKGVINNLPSMANVNYGSSPKGQRIWYKLINESVKAEPTFLMPPEIVRGLDISQPIYLYELGGYYLIEEIGGYVDQSTPVKIKIIKLSVSGEFNNDFNNDFNNK